MRAIDTELLVEQKKTAYTPYVAISFQQQSDLPRLSLLASPTLSVDYHAIAAGSSGGAVFVQARQYIYGGTYKLQTRRITDPSQASQWTAAWTDMKSGIYKVALFWTGVYTVLVYVDTSTLVAYWRRSSDGGQTWSSEQTGWSVGSGLFGDIVGVNGFSKSGVFYQLGVDTIKFRRYDHSTDTWGAEQSFSLGADVGGSFGAEYDGGNSYRLAIPIKGPGSELERSIQLCKYTYPSTFTEDWTHLRLSAEESAVPYEIHGIDLRKVETGWWMTYVIESGGLAGVLNWDSDVFVSWNTGADFRFFSAGMRLGYDSLMPYKCALIQHSTADVYVVGDRRVYRSPEAELAKSFSPDRVVSYNYDEGGQDAGLTVILDNPGSGDLDFLESGYLGANVIFSAGAVVGGTSYGVDRLLILSEVEWLDYNARVRIIAQGAELLLNRWRAYQSYIFDNETIEDVISAVAALVGIMSVSFDADSVWDLLISLVIQPGQSARSALNSLATQFQFRYRISDFTLICFVLDASPSVDYVFGGGAGEHPLIDIKSSSRRVLPKTTHVAVAGNVVSGEALSTTLQTEIGRMFTQIVSRRYVQSDTEAKNIANRLLDVVETGVDQGRLVHLPAFHLQPWDVVSFDGFGNNQERYISRLKEQYGDKGLLQSLDVGNVAQQATGGSGGGGGVSMRLEGGGLAVARGRLVSFDDVAWTALVRIEGNAGAVTLNVGHWNHKLILEAKADVAVLLFDESNPNDGLVLGPCGGGPPPAWPGAGILQID